MSVGRMSKHTASNAPYWSYEAEVHKDHGGADVFHHIVCGDRHVAEVETEADAHLIVGAVNGLFARGMARGYIIPPGKGDVS